MQKREKKESVMHREDDEGNKFKNPAVAETLNCLQISLKPPSLVKNNPIFFQLRNIMAN